jgi:hypothetical protein
MKAVGSRLSPFVIPAKAGIQPRRQAREKTWTPACAGVTGSSSGMTET